MSSIRSKNTLPELKLRKGLWNQGHRYRIHDASIFGKPDISIKKQKIAIFVDGCFWHGCKTCYTPPKSNKEFWRKKIMYNTSRRKLVKKTLHKQNWKVIEVWEHQIKNEFSSVLKKIQFQLTVPEAL